MSECKGNSSGTPKEDVELMEEKKETGKSFKGYSAMVFFRKGKNKRKQSRTNPHNLSNEFKEHGKKPPIISSATRKGEGLCFEEASNEFTCSSSIIESYQLSTNKAKYCFRKLEDGTFVMEKKEEMNQEKSEPITRKRSTKACHQKGRYAHKPLKICFKKRSKTLRKNSDSNDDDQLDIKSMTSTQYEATASTTEIQSEHAQRGKKWATFKMLVAHKKNLHSSLKCQSQNEANPSNVCIQRVSKKKRFSNLRIPCMNFSRGKKSICSNIATEDIFCATNPVESQEDYPGYCTKRSDKAIAIKYKLQKSENGKISNNTDQCMFKPSDEFQSLPKLKRVMDQLTQGTDKKISNKQLKRPNVDTSMISSLQERGNYVSESNKEGLTNVTSRHELNDSGFCYSYTKDLAETQESGKKDERYHENFTDCEDKLNQMSLDNDIISRGPILLDPHEMLLITTAANLVKKVLQASVQQLVDEGTL